MPPSDPRTTDPAHQAHPPQARLSQDWPAPRGDIRDLFSFQLQRLAGLSTRIAALSIRPRFGITSREWRALAVLSYLHEAPLQELARHSGLLKSQMSRTVAGLIDRGLVQRSANPEDGRSILLRLSPDGKRMADEILAMSRDRNDRMLASLSPGERQLLMELLQRVFRTSHDHYAEIRRLAPQDDTAEADDE